MELSITAQSRTALGKLNEKLRSAGLIPAVLYGKSKPANLQVSAKAFEKVFKAAGESTLVNLVVEGEGKHKVLIHDVAKHYMKNVPIHVDFYEVDLTKKIHAKVPLEFVGVSAAVKEHGGIFMKNLNEVEVEALPSDLPHKITVDIEGLKTFEDKIHASDLKVAGNVKILTSPEDVIVMVQRPRTEEELAELEKPTAEAEKAAIEGLAAEAEKEKGEKAAEAGEEPAKAEEKKEAPKAETKPEKK